MSKHNATTTRKCPKCHHVKDTVRERENPYVKEVFGQSFIELMCDDCEVECTKEA